MKESGGHITECHCFLLNSVYIFLYCYSLLDLIILFIFQTLWLISCLLKSSNLVLGLSEDVASFVGGGPLGQIRTGTVDRIRRTE